MHQADHAQRNRDRDTGGYQGTLARAQLDIDRAVEVDAGVAGVGAAGQRQIWIKADDRETGRHEAQDYP
ncbi:hypothetical protein MTER_16650 [Mycolicibacter terrae]|uniref:Uncharacterized protein n=1 Tax=Mycolicibacter terrae TaxID=1788 RepID=A0AAD1HW18_9MYCO|nr:hypothetical protein MTER_16650 [Mycolicibacter terrae]